MKAYRFFRKFHRWLGLLIGLQVCLWVAGGLVMSFFDIEKVRGENNIAKKPEIVITQTPTVSANEVLQKIDFKPVQLRLGHWQQRLVWRAKAGKQFAMIDAQTAELLSPFSLEIAQKVALADWSGQGAIVDAESTNEAHYEIRGRELPLWRFQFDDADNTRIYVSPVNGEVVARRNDTWRLFDFFWMLHIMDYEGRDDFNHPLLIIAALLALLFSFSGIYLVYRTVFINRRERVKKA